MRLITTVCSYFAFTLHDSFFFLLFECGADQGEHCWQHKQAMEQSEHHHTGKHLNMAIEITPSDYSM